MPGATGPRLGLVWGYVPGETGWGVGGFNPNFAKLEALVHLTVIGITATPPATPVNGDCYIVGTGATGVWAGHTDDIAVYYTAGGWLFIDPAIGVRAFDRTGDNYIRFDGVDWIEEILPDADVAGPLSAVDGNIVVFDGSTGKIIADGGKALPATPLVGLGDNQELTNKIILGSENTLQVRLVEDTTGNLPVTRLNGGVSASNTTYWRGDGTWAAAAGGAGSTVSVGDLPPTDPDTGDLWFDGETAQLFVFFSGQWVIAVNPGTGGGGGAGVMSLTTGDGLSDSGPVGDVHVELICPVAIEDGGTGAETAAGALVNLGAAPLLSPAFVGTPTAPTASPGTVSGQLATTAYVANAMSGGAVTSVTAGAGLTGGGTGAVTVALSAPVGVSLGGTGAVDAAGARTALGCYPVSGGVLQGALQADGPVSASGYRRSMLEYYEDGTDGWVTLLGAYADAPGQGIYLGNQQAFYRNAKHIFVRADDPANIYATLDDNGVTAKNFIANQGSGGTVRIYADAEGHIESSGILHLNGASKALVRAGGGVAAGGNPYAILNHEVVSGEDWVSLYHPWANSQHGGIHIAGNINTTYHRMNQHNFQDYNGTVSWAVIDATGCYNTSGSWTVISDRELKEGIEPYQRGLAALVNLTPYSYRYREGTPFAGAQGIGLMADEVKPHIPEIVGSTVVEQQEVDTIAPTSLLYCMLNSIKELEARIRELESR